MKFPISWSRIVMVAALVVTCVSGIAQCEEHSKKGKSSKKKIESRVVEAQIMWIDKDGKVYSTSLGHEGPGEHPGFVFIPGDSAEESADGIEVDANVIVVDKGGKRQTILKHLSRLQEIVPEVHGLLTIVGADGDEEEFDFSDRAKIKDEVRKRVEDSVKDLSREARARALTQVEAALARVADQRRVLARIETSSDASADELGTKMTALSDKLDTLLDRLDNLEADVRELREHTAK